MSEADLIESYLAQHGITSMLNTMVNDLCKDRPADPITFMINHLLKVGSSSGKETALVQRLKHLQKTLEADKAEADAAVKKAAEVEKENTKLNYRITHLLRTMDEMEQAPQSAGSSVKVPAMDSSEVPAGHTAFSWAGGVNVASSGGSSAPAAGAAAAGSEPVKESFSDRVGVKTILTGGSAFIDKQVTVNGWAKTARVQKELAFVEITDGSTLKGLQVVVDAAAASNWEELKKSISTGAALHVEGKLVESPAKGQIVEMHATSVQVLGTSDNAVYPLAFKTASSLEHLRSVAHLRPRTNTGGAVMRIRNALAFAVHSFFQSKNFMYVHSPLITASDCEGAGEMFQVTTLDLAKPLPKDKAGKVDYKDDFFAKQAFLTVSGQLNAEFYACAMSNVYTFGPTFRAENSHTTRHLAEFWMIEPEIAFADIVDDMNCAEGLLRHCFQHVLDNCDEDLQFLTKFYDKSLMERLSIVTSQPFQRITYTEAVEICSKANKKWEFTPEWGKELQTEHERFLAEEVYKKPVIVYNYPKECKAFYMRCNDDGKTVAAMDVLFPKVGEMVGGSQREERLEILEARMKECGLEPKDYGPYLDTRRYGTQKHAGFGVGFERLVLYATAMENIRDVIPFPRTPGACTF